MDQRRKALEEMEKRELVEIVLRLQTQLKEARYAIHCALDDGFSRPEAIPLADGGG